jgi:hypothetical protein
MWLVRKKPPSPAASFFGRIGLSRLRQIVGTMLKFLTNGYCFAAEMWRHNRIAVAKGNTRRFLNQMHIIATHARHRA